MQNSGDQFRSKRQLFATQIRRHNRQEILAKRRNINSQSQQVLQQTTNSAQHIIDNRYSKKVKQFHTMLATKQQFIQYIASTDNQDIIKQHYGLIGIRKLLSQKKNPPIQQVIDSGLIPRIISYAKQTQYPQLQLQAVWCLTNIAAGTTQQTQTIIQKGGIKIFVDMLLYSHVGIVQQAIWALGNIACDSHLYRDMIVRNGGLANLTKLIYLSIQQLPKNPSVRQIIQSATWTLSCICRTRPLPNYLLIQQALPIFFYVIKNNLIKDISILANICWAISYYSNKIKQGPKKIDKIQNCIDAGVLPYIVQYLGSSYDSLVVSCLKIIGNIANGNDQQSAYLINLGIVDRIQKMLYKPKKVYRRQCCWILSNLTAGNAQQIQTMLSKQTLIKKLLQMLTQDIPQIRIQICYIFSNITQQGNQQKSLKFLTQINFLKILITLIQSKPDKQLLCTILQCLYIILQFGYRFTLNKKNNIFVKLLYQMKALEIIENLQYHQEDKIYQQATKILMNYFQIVDPLSL